MLTDEDVAKLSSVLSTKLDIVDLKADLARVKESVDALTISVDAILGKLATLKMRNFSP